MNAQLFHRPATIERNKFKYKSLSCFSYNIAIGCAHACRFCYVPEVSTNRMATRLKEYGIEDPDADWGDYVLLRQWDPHAFHLSLLSAEAISRDKLNADGNRAVMLCTTTDPYQVASSKDLSAGDFGKQRNMLVQYALGLTLAHSTLNVRILTRSPLARLDFPLMKSFGNRLLFGMSLPTLNNQLSTIYEPKAPAPSQRLATLRAAKAAGIPIYVAVAPVYPDCDEADMAHTLLAVRDLDPVTIFMEPINIRAENVQRIEAHAKQLGVPVKTEVFRTTETWARYALDQLKHFEGLAHDLGLADKLHLWPDASLVHRFPAERDWLARQWQKISAWPS